jgi:hypothetical protein
MTDFEKWHEKNWPLERSAGIDDCWDELQEAYEAGAASQFDELPDGLTVNASELNAPAIHIQNDAGDWAKIEYDGTFACSNPDAVTELAELFWNHLATLGPLFGAGAEANREEHMRKVYPQLFPDLDGLSMTPEEKEEDQ